MRHSRGKKLKIGRIPYANLFPLFYFLDKKCDCSGYTFIKGVPSRLNRMLREGKLDISPSSSIEYLRDKKKYSIFPGLSISSSGPVNSILLFSKLPLNELDGKTVGVSPDSETSVALLRIILKDFFSVKCRVKTIRYKAHKKNLSRFPAILLIGDDAMKESKKSTVPHVFDLGELWYNHTGLPFVFALWIVRKDALPDKEALINKFLKDLRSAQRYTSGRLTSIAKEAPQKKWIKERELLSYWKGISYNFSTRHKKGLRLFEKYIIKNKLTQ
jgi:chorismate dehydratase